MIAPWNFPFAIPTGMTAALAAGNSVVLKPAEQAPASAHAVVATLREAGVPAPPSPCCRASATSAPRSCAIPACT